MPQMHSYTAWPSGQSSSRDSTWWPTLTWLALWQGWTVEMCSKSANGTLCQRHNINVFRVLEAAWSEFKNVLHMSCGVSCASIRTAPCSRCRQPYVLQLCRGAKSDRNPTCLVVGHVHLPELQDALCGACGPKRLETHIWQRDVCLLASSLRVGLCSCTQNPVSATAPRLRIGEQHQKEAARGQGARYMCAAGTA